MAQSGSFQWLKPGDCVRIHDDTIEDILLIEKQEPNAPHKLSGTLMSTGEKVRLLIVNNYMGSVHMHRAYRGVIHFESLLPMSEPDLLGWMLDRQRRLNQAVRGTKERASAFRRNCKAFQVKMAALK